MSRPIDIATGETVAFLAANLPRGSRVLEVGCGEGHVALALRDRGCRVLGLESSAGPSRARSGRLDRPNPLPSGASITPATSIRWRR